MTYLLQLWKAILLKTRVLALAKMSCSVNGCSKTASRLNQQPLALRRGDIALCESHIDALKSSTRDALEEAKALNLPAFDDLIYMTELRELLYPTGNPRLKLVE